MNTSYYGLVKNHPRAVSIAARAPEWFRGPQYKKVSPKYWFFKKYKEDGDTEFYTAHFNEEVLDKLDPKVIYQELKEIIPGGPILTCYEKPEEFCHRHLVAKWLSENLNIEITEFKDS